MKNGFVFSLIAVCLAVLAFSQSSPLANPGGPYNGAPGESISFSGSQSTAPTGQTLTFAWSFGDGATGTGVNPTHSYSAAGIFTVSLTVTASSGGTSTATTTATIATAPTAKPGGPYNGVANQTISFNGSGSTGPSGLTLSYAWDFGDGSSATGATPTHAYLSSGTYSVKLTVVDPLGGSNSATTTTTVLSANSPVANTGGPYTGTISQSLTFNGSASTGPSGLTYLWNFGDGGTGSGVGPTHAYAVTGSFTVSLTVTASGAGSNTATTTATILTAPVANAGGPYNASAGQPTTFNGAASTGPSGKALTYAWQFGDGSTGTGVSPSHTYSAAGSFTVSLIVSDGFGASNAATTKATIIAAPVANAGGPYNWTAGSALSFSGSASTAPSGQTLTYSWSFGDGGTATGATPTHTYTTANTFTVSLTVTDTSGGTNTASVSAVIAAAPAANAGGPYNQIPGQSITFNGSKSTGPSGQTLAYAWTFGDGATGTGVNPTHAYTAAGTYTVSLTVTDPIGGSNIATSAATIAAGPLANAGGTYIGTMTQPIAFNGSGSTGPSGQTLSYAWNFGDGGTGIGVSPSHAYTATGTYTVSLTVNASGGGSNTTTTTATALNEPVANAGGSYTGTVSQAVSFNASKSTGPAGQTLSELWNFGDGSTGTGLNPTHTYSAVGSYNVSLTVSDTVGGSSKSTTTALVLAAPVANAGGPYSGTAAQSLTFNGSLSTAPPAQILSYAWNFGDGGTGTGVNPTHTYSTAGSYSVTLTLTDSSGGSSTATTTATIGKSNTPVANAGGPYNGTAGAPLTFSASASTGPTGQPLSYQWNFGDGSTGTGVSPAHSYRSTGSYTVAVTVATNNGASSTASTTASIASTPVANAGGPYNERPGTPVAFNGSKSTAPSGQTLTYAWAFGDGATGTGVTASHSYAAGGNYTVSLTVTDGIGGTSTASATATIGNGPVAQAGGPYAGPPGKTMAFNGSNSTGPSGQTLTYDWSFGDGSTATGVSPSHSYSVSGTYNVSLTVIDSVGESNTSSVAATITNAPVANAGGPYNSIADQLLTSMARIPLGRQAKHLHTTGTSAMAAPDLA
jgi:PKD repeat protein